jgi:fucose 4-O-acetylase-like acetyltransferase
VSAVAPPSRDPWLDNIKMVLVTLVVVGHAIGLVEDTAGSHWVYDFIYLWHIPAFVFVSGYLSKSFEWDRRRMKSLLYTLAVPYLLFEPALFYFRRDVVGEGVEYPLWIEPHWTMWYLIVLLMWRLITPILKSHWLFLPLSVIVSLAGGLWDTEALMIPRFLGLLPFFVLGLHLKPRHLKHLDDVWVRIAAVPTLVGIGVMAVYTDTWAETALLWYDTGYNEIPIDNEIVFQTRLTIMMVGLLGAFSAMSLVPRRNLGWFTTMGTATMVIYLFHGFVIKTVKLLGWPDFTAAHPWLGLVLTILGAVALTFFLASPPVRRVLEPLTNPLGTLEKRFSARREPTTPQETRPSA